jgi:hypothetical protein
MGFVGATPGEPFMIARGANCSSRVRPQSAERIYGGTRNFVAPLPNADSIRLWSTLARSYKDEPAVLYDLFTEPHDCLNDDPFPLNRADGTVYPVDQRQVTMQDWQCHGNMRMS